MIKELTTLANDLDKRGLVKEADILDGILKNAFDWFRENYEYGDNDISFKLINTHSDENGDSCETKLEVSADAKLVEESAATISYRWDCVSPDDPYNDTGKYANITLQFSKTGPINNDEIAQAIRESGDRSKAQQIALEVGKYCIDPNPRVSNVNTKGCDND